MISDTARLPLTGVAVLKSRKELRVNLDGACIFFSSDPERGRQASDQYPIVELAKIMIHVIQTRSDSIQRFPKLR